MAPNPNPVVTPSYEGQVPLSAQDTKAQKKYEYKIELVWRNIILMALLHISALYGLILAITGQAYFSTVIFHLTYGYLSGSSITGGAHRLWAHKSYKATWPLRLFLGYFQAAAFQNTIFDWVRDHRVHHKFCDTNADPHNSRRGFFFSHVGWLMVRKHKDVIEKGKTIDMSDLEKDWIVMFQKKYFFILMPMCWLIIPALTPWYFWGETLSTSVWLNITRYVLILHMTWCVNSLAHMWGDKPFNKNLSSTNNLFVGIIALGEGWHNYHHSFPWDYRTSELWNINTTTKFINFFIKLGWAYDLKEASDELIRKKIFRTGDGSHMLCTKDVNKDQTKPKEEGHHHKGELWGFDDKDMTLEERNMILIVNKKDK